ncbi:DDE family transposase [Ancylobacter aquaticus]|uniref:DDE family transposase n=1 Tax=Ancylobacter aquaticus TaxID=100 RepID=A0A4V2PH86_ANCAQ|nr:DDE family transposase [Ancylobacter aquaticus]
MIWFLRPGRFPHLLEVAYDGVVRRLLFRTIHDVALMLDRDRKSREQFPSAAVVDSQSIKASTAEKGGFDAGKKVVGRKRHIAADTDGWLLMVNLTAADISDSAGAQAIVAAIRKLWPWLKRPFADCAYDRTRLMDAVGYRDFVLEIVRRTNKEPGFKVLARRWLVERTFGWMTHWKRLVRDYKQRLDVSEAMIHVAPVSLIPRRIVNP